MVEVLVAAGRMAGRQGAANAAVVPLGAADQVVVPAATQAAVVKEVAVVEMLALVVVAMAAAVMVVVATAVAHEVVVMMVVLQAVVAVRWAAERVACYIDRRRSHRKSLLVWVACPSCWTAPSRAAIVGTGCAVGIHSTRASGTSKWWPCPCDTIEHIALASRVHCAGVAGGTSPTFL